MTIRAPEHPCGCDCSRPHPPPGDYDAAASRIREAFGWPPRQTGALRAACPWCGAGPWARCCRRQPWGGRVPLRGVHPSRLEATA
ncbi:zinc finger domain-containing protein [Nocardioides guangzhouensis]|uniref:zinc finger domain-containing protein n=1 Tax=Nocardioides guangzhouensis TaxID=2497878 RepID=UPI003CCC7AB5